MSFTRANGLPKFTSSPTLSKRDLETARINNQFVVNGNTPTYPGDLTAPNKKVIVFLEYYFAKGVGAINDGSNTPVLTSVLANFHYDYGFSPIRLDGGVRFTANGVIAKGFFIEVGIDMDQGVQ